MAYQANSLTKLVRVRGRAGVQPTQHSYVVATSTTIKQYDIVCITTGSVVQQAILVPSTNSTIVTSGSVAVLGIALAPISTNSAGVEATTGRTTIPVAILDDNCEVGLRFYNATGSSAELQDVTLGTSYQFGNYRAGSASDWWYMASTTTTNGELTLVDKPEWENQADDYGFAWFRVVTTAAIRQG